MALKTRNLNGGKGMNGTETSKGAQGATRAGWGRAGTGKGPKLRSKGR